MKKIITLSCLMIAGNIAATQITNLTSYPADVKVVYSMQCGDADPSEAEYTFTLPPKNTADISGSPLIRGPRFCQTVIDSIKAKIRITDTDATIEVANTVFGPFNQNQRISIRSTGSVRGKNLKVMLN